MMLQKRFSVLTEIALSECLLFLCTRDLARSLTYLLTLWYRYFLPCPPMPRGRSDLPRLQRAVLPLMMFCPSIFIMLFFMELYLVTYRFGYLRFLVFWLFHSLVLPAINVTLTAPFLSYPAIDTGNRIFSLLSFLDNALILPILCCNVDVNILL